MFTAESTTVYVVDDDRQARESVCALVRSMGGRAESFESAERFLERYEAGSPGCLVSDMRMFGMSGLELQEKMVDERICLPVILITAFPKTHTTVRAIQMGAVNVIEKPYDDDSLWDAIRKAVAIDRDRRGQFEQLQAIQTRFHTLTDKEQKVLELIVAGSTNKTIASTLNVSVRTVENRRREVFEKMQASSVAELVKMAIRADLVPQSS